MPIYEYRCGSCSFESEHLQKVSDAPIADCPECGGEYTKLISAAGFQLKGSGWYATDFKNGATKPAAKAVAAKETVAAPACGAGACPACTTD